MKTWFASLRVQWLLAGAALWAALFIGAAWVSDQALRRALESSVSEHLLADAALVADEARPWLPRQADLDPDSAVDARLRDVLGRAVADGLAKDVTVLDARGLVLLDATGESVPGFPAAELAPTDRRILDSGRGLALAPQRGAFGQWTQSVYVPLGRGPVLRLDADPRQLAVLDAWRRMGLIAGGLGLALCALAALLAAGWVLKPVRWIANAARSANGSSGGSTPPPSLGGGELGRAVRDVAASLGRLEAERLEARLRRELAERKAHDLEQVARAIAHEVRNPLAVIRGQAELMARATPGGAPALGPARIVGEVDQLERVVEGFLELGRAPRLRCERVSASDLVRELYLSLEALKAGPQWIVEDGGATADAVFVDKALVQGALLNLGLNALQAMPAGGAVLVRATRDGSKLLIEISDEGPGFDARSRDRLFEPFFTTKARGNGLGLPLARRAAEAHGGELRLLDGSPGARFGFFLPLEHGEA